MVAVLALTAATLPTRPPAATTGWPTAIPLVVPLSTVTVFSKLDEPVVDDLHRRRSGWSPRTADARSASTCWAADCSAAAWIDCCCRPATWSRRRWFSRRSEP